MLRKRIVTAIIILPLFIAAIWFGTPWFTLALSIFAVLGCLEFYRMTSNHNIHPITSLGVIITFLLIISPHCPYISIKPLIITIAIIISLIWLLFRSPNEEAFNNWTWTIAGILYIGLMLSYWIDLRNLESGRELVFWFFLMIVANDICAFFVGRALGKHPLASNISPNKTWEGAIGGLLGSILIAILFGILFSVSFNYWYMALSGFIISVFAQLGDLVESLLKRNTCVKDSSKLLPGHGGILDRVDSFILTGAIAYHYVIYLAL